MKKTFLVSAWFVVAACGATRLNDVGDIDDGGGSGGASSGGSKSMPSGGKAAGGKATGGTDAVAGSDDPPLDGVAGWPSWDYGLTCETCEEVADAPDIRGIWLTSERVYWTEFGTTDELDNYENDGRLMSMSLSGGSPVEVVTGLQGPTWLALGDLYAYVWLERSSSPQGRKQLARVSLDGGDVELLQQFDAGMWVGQDLARRFFAFGGGYAYWFQISDAAAQLGAVFRLAESADLPIEEVVPAEDARLTADDDNLYIHTFDGIRARPHAGGVTQPILSTGSSYDPMTLVGDAFFGFELDRTNYYAVTLPVAGGAVERVGKATNPYAPSQMATDGVRFVGSVQTVVAPDLAGATLIDGDLTAPDEATPLAFTPPWRDEETGRTTYHSVRTWDANATDVYLGYEGKLYRIPRVTE